VNATTQSGDPVLVGAGDIANCSSLAGAEATAKLLDSIPGTVYTLGDNAYGSGTATEFANCYDPTWGRHKARTKPAPGNHEYYTSGATGYFGSAAGDPLRGYYSYELGRWHVVVLNTNDQCKYVSCSAGSRQEQWLHDDLAAHPAQCTLAYFHYPLFTSGNYSPGISTVKPLWDELYSGGADVVLNGHDHIYERFAPQSPSGALDTARGIREFVVGTGGAEHYGIKTVQLHSEVRNADTFGVLKLTLHPTSYDWQFVPEAGKTFTDSGSTSCH
jgi:predicted phosphohydrolase